MVSERSLVETKTHSHALTVAARGDGGAIVGWLEDDPSSTEMLEYDGKAGWGAFVARVDAGGFVVQAPGLVPIDPSVGHGVPTNIVADCSGACRLVLGFAIAWATREGMALLGSTAIGAAPRHRRVRCGRSAAPPRKSSRRPCSATWPSCARMAGRKTTGASGASP